MALQYANQRALLSGTSVIPIGVGVANLLAVWNLQYTAGLSAPGSLAAVNAGMVGTTLPTGTTVGASDVFFVRTGGPYTVSNVDFSNKNVWIDTVTYTFNNCKFYDPAQTLIRFGKNGGTAPTVTFNNCLFDMTDAAPPGAFEAPLYGAGTIVANNCRFQNAPGDFFSSTSASASWSFTDCAFIDGCRNPGAAHYDGIGHLYGGTYSFLRCLVYHPSGAPPLANWSSGGGATGTFFPEPTVANITGTIDQCIFQMGLMAPMQFNGQRASYNIQFGANATFTTNSMTLTNSLLDSGTSGYVTKTATAPAGTLTHSGNVDLWSGASIEGLLP